MNATTTALLANVRAANIDREPVKRAQEPEERHQGDLYDGDARPADNARTIRRLLKDAVKSGALPGGLKTSVKTRTYAGGASIDVTITSLPAGVRVFSDEYVRDTIIGGGLSSGPWRHATLAELLAKVEAIAARVQRKRTHWQSDYCNANFLMFVDVAGDLKAKARAGAA